MKNKILIVCLVVLAIIINIFNSVLATTNKIIDPSMKGSLSLTIYEFINGDENKKRLLEDAEFTIYLVSNSIEDINSAENYIATNETTKYTKKSNDNGQIFFKDLQLGRYYVKQVDAPRNVLTKVESFLVDIPSINEDGTEWNYDVIAYPKNVTIYGHIELNKRDNNNNAMEGVKFVLQKKVDNEWKDYELENDLVTDSAGKIEIQNIEAGQYRLIEVKSLETFIVDSSNTQEFEVSLNNTEININMSNEKVDLNKYVKLNNDEYGKHIGANVNDVVSWKITSSVPSIISKMKTYSIHDELEKGLEIVKDSIKVYGDNEIISDEIYSVNIENQIMNVTFEPKQLSSYSEVEITYDTSITGDIEYGKATTNKVSATYTSKIDVDGSEADTYTTIPNDLSTAEVHSGQVLIYKTDGKNALNGAIFKIATSKENAENGVYITDKNGEDITATSDDNGYVVFSGLKYGEDDIDANNANSFYWIVEVQAPSYETENEEIKYYNLLDKPIKIQVNANSGNFTEYTTKVINRKGFLLPMTGNIGIISIFVGIVMFLISFLWRKTKNEKNKKTSK